MKDKIEIGEYVRFLNGKIFKVFEIEDEWLLNKNGIGMIKGSVEDVKKHSKNIIDLVEIRDIVKVKDTFDEDVLYVLNEEFITALKEDIEDESTEIIEILTHEQYENNCYKVEQ